MTAKEYLSELQLMKFNIEQLQEQKQTYMDMATSITAAINPVKVQTTSKNDRMGDSVAKLADISKEIDEEITALLIKQDKVLKQIRELHNLRYIQILSKVYVQGKNIKVAASEMGMSYPYVRELHKSALATFEEKYMNNLYTSENFS